jgi:hypothetical protein
MNNKCQEIAKKYFPEKDFEIVHIYEYEGGCVIDFKRKKFEPYINCEDYCNEISYLFEEEEIKECIEECEDTLKTAVTGSMSINIEDHTIRESTIPGSCRFVWTEKEEETKEMKEFENELKKAGCETTSTWIHPHELISKAGEFEGEYPAVCYFHIYGCKAGDALRIIEKYV